MGGIKAGANGHCPDASKTMNTDSNHISMSQSLPPMACSPLSQALLLMMVVTLPLSPETTLVVLTRTPFVELLLTDDINCPLQYLYRCFRLLSCLKIAFYLYLQYV